MELRIVHQSLVPIYLILFFILTYLTYLTYKNIYVLSERRKKIITILRIIVWALIIISLINPVFTFYQIKRVKEKFIFLLDTSASMSILDKFKESRFERGTKIIDYVKNLTKDYENLFYGFDREVRPIDINSLKNINWGDATDIENALSSATSGIEGISGIFLISDGINNLFSDPLKEAKILKKMKIPIFAYDFSQNENIKDISIFNVEYPEECFLDSQVGFKVKVSQIGFNNSPIEMKVFLNDKFYQSYKMKLDKIFNNINLNLKFSKTGINKVRFFILPNENETVDINNEWTIFLKVFKSKIKVLVVYGKVCWEYKFLVYSLSLDPNIEFDSFVKIKENSLIPLKNLALTKYDVIIIGNIKYNDLPEEFVENILNYVHLKSGSILFLGGENSFKSGGYENSKLKDLISVNWNKAGDLLKTDFTLKLTSYGISLPVMKVGQQSDIEKLWSNLPPCSFLNVIKEVSPNMNVLAVSSINPSYIVLAIGNYKRSRIGIFTAYPTWKWAFLPLGVGKDSDVYHNFWRQLIRFLATTDIEKLNVSTSKLQYKLNDEVVIRVNAQNYKKNEIFANLYLKKNENYQFIKKVSLFALPSFEGLYETIFVPKEYGEYKISVNIGDLYKESFFVVEKPMLEFNNLICNNDLLEQICNITGGIFIKEKNNLPKILKYLKKEKKFLKVKREIFLWNNWFILIIIILFLSYEWYYRKMSGLL